MGSGPSASHTMGPAGAARAFAARTTAAAAYRVILYGSLAATGRGHMTDKAVIESLAPKGVDFVWKPDEVLPYHPNALRLVALDAAGGTLEEGLFYSIGGGEVHEEGVAPDTPDVYPDIGMTDLLQWCRDTGRPYWEYAWENEDAAIEEYLGEVRETMKQSIARGLATGGVLPGGLKLPRKAQSFYRKVNRNSPEFRRSGLLYSYALAVSEENAALGRVVTAPTCGSSGVLPSVLR